MYDMCRCCQICIEDIYWNCIEERFCYDESIANYNPDEDEEITTKNNGIISGFQTNDNNNTTPVCSQPMRRVCSTISSKIHEEDYRREIQTSVPILAPEILSVFANSQIFADHQPKIPRNKTKSNLPGIHGENGCSLDINDEKLLRKLEGTSDIENFYNTETGDKKIKFTISSDSDSPVELRRSMSPQKFSAIIEEDSNYKDKDDLFDNSFEEAVAAKTVGTLSSITAASTIPKDSSFESNFVEKKPLRSVQSVPYFTFRQANDNDIFSISGSLGRISMTPEVPSISYTSLPKNYIETPTIDKYKESASLYAIQAANKAKALEEDYSMPRYFRMPSMLAQSTGNLTSIRESPLATDQSKKVEKGKRLKLLRGSLPPLLIHTVRNNHMKKDEMKILS